MINSTPAYSIGYTLISRQGSCTTISPSNPVCWVYKSNAMEVASNTYGFQIAPAQTLAYSNTVTQPGNYILLVSADEGERQFANTYLNFTIAGNFVVPISVTNNQALSTGSNFQQMITFNSVAYRSYETNDLGNMRFYQGPNELYSWCESITCRNTWPTRNSPGFLRSSPPPEDCSAAGSPCAGTTGRTFYKHA